MWESLIHCSLSSPPVSSDQSDNSSGTCHYKVMPGIRRWLKVVISVNSRGLYLLVERVRSTLLYKASKRSQTWWSLGLLADISPRLLDCWCKRYWPVRRLPGLHKLFKKAICVGEIYMMFCLWSLFHAHHFPVAKFERRWEISDDEDCENRNEIAIYTRSDWYYHARWWSQLGSPKSIMHNQWYSDGLRIVRKQPKQATAGSMEQSKSKGTSHPRNSTWISFQMACAGEDFDDCWRFDNESFYKTMDLAGYQEYFHHSPWVQVVWTTLISRDDRSFLNWGDCPSLFTALARRRHEHPQIPKRPF